jgi:hypothetical protein
VTRRDKLPPPLPPETRPVGQLIAEALRFYGNSFWQSLPLGLPIAIVNQISAGNRIWVQVAILAAAAPALSGAYVAACLLIRNGPWLPAFLLGTVLILPLPVLMLLYVFPAVAYLAFVGLSVPAAIFERLSVRGALRRGVALAKADFVHAFGGLAAIVLIFVVTKLSMIVLLHDTAEATERVAIFLADLVLSPLLFLVPAFLYFDQAARLESGTQPRRKRDADLHSPVEPHAAGRPDSEVKP